MFYKINASWRPGHTPTASVFAHPTITILSYLKHAHTSRFCGASHTTRYYDYHGRASTSHDLMRNQDTNKMHIVCFWGEI